MNTYDMITEVLKREGWDKYTNHPEDRGGPTKWGITLKAWSEYIDRQATAADVAAITETNARIFYQKEYVLKPNFDMIEDESLRELVVDCGVNHGVYRAAKWLQLAAGVIQDGKVGPKTLEAVNTADAFDLRLRIIAYRIKLYGKLVTKDPTQAKFAWGWNNRAASFLLTMSGED